jgi:protoporphyrinogen oxidase
MVLDYGLARLRSLARRRTPDTFAEDLKQRVGARLYDVLFRPIAEKLWGDGKKLDAKLSKGRVQTPRLSEVLGRLLKIKKVSEFEALEFIYPKNGLQTLWETIRTKGQGVGAFVTGAEVRALEVESGRVVGIEYFNSGGQQLETISVSEHDFVFSTLPIALLADLLRPAPSAATRRLIQEKIVLNDLMLVFLHIDLPSLFEDSWIFVPDPEIIFHRVCEQKAFDPGMTPHGSVVCCEVMNNELRARGGLSDAELERAAEEGLRKMGFRSFRVQHQRVIRLPQSYPVFRPGFEEALDAILKEFDAIENCRTIGRQGAFNYIGTLDAMDIGYGAAEWFLTKARGQSAAAEKAAAWRAERERTRHYPVLD